MKKELIIARAIALAAEYFSKSAQGTLKDYHDNVDTFTGSGTDLMLTLMRYTKDDKQLNNLIEMGALVTHCIDHVNVDIEMFTFPERNWEYNQ